MATPEFITQLREHIGNAPLWVPATTTVVIREVPADAPIWEVPTVLLVKRADTGDWTPIGGICEPGEQPHATAVREVKRRNWVGHRTSCLARLRRGGASNLPQWRRVPVHGHRDIC